MISRNFSTKIVKRGISNASSESLRTAKSLKTLLNEVDRYYGDNVQIKAKLNALDAIGPTTIDENKFEQRTITLGIVHGKGATGGLLTNSLIADPFSSTPPTPVINEFRKKHRLKNIKVLPTDTNANEYVGMGIFKLKSPFLSAENRVIHDIKQGDGSSKYLETLKERGVFNDISLMEVNDLKFSEINDVEGVQEITLSDESKLCTTMTSNDAQLWVYVTNDTTDVDLINDLPYIVVVDGSSNGISRGQTIEATNMAQIKKEIRPNDSIVNLGKIEQANDLLGMNMKNVSEFLRLYRESNIHELLYGLILSTSGYNVQIHLLKSLIRDIISIENDQSESEKKVIGLEHDEIKKKLETEVKNWSQRAHYDLQSTVDPFLTKVLLQKYSGLAALVINSGDLSIVLSNILLQARDDIKVKKGLIFGKSIEGYGSLKDTWGRGKYLEGKIDAIVPLVEREKESLNSKENQSIDSIERNANARLTDEILPSLQGRLNQILIQNLTLPPLITSIVTSIGFIEDMISLNTGCSITLFAVVLGAFRAQGEIGRVMSETKRSWLEELRKSVEIANQYLWKKIGINVEEKDVIQDDKKRVLNKLRDDLKEMERVHNQFMRK